ncbi:MAG: hypothetical protein CLLPBCKN_000367 [Chroococcidiopsis cubana SAG 39.79]|uniref:NADP-dependent oxidoreductase domain-containing protein n=2 Tax=Chroococcidiopsis TaxID=54298 RepID=A0AB37U7X0_9CYAN|nr:aldo/keto reductase [Chroococcidiopsis cubana]MDZ4870979.1 hypothetical protein [Chroococcidiopsis cubana SAG 39.79]RUS94919.1 hypothetical protein DSM107010_71650 [Chroococcidiopsis cubana SAG 39.79]
MEIVTQQGHSASILGLAASGGMDVTCIAAAFEAGINYFFFYDFTNEKFLAGLRSLLATKREQVLVATGSQERDLNWLRRDFDSVRQQLNIDVVDAFFVEYIYPAEDLEQVEALLEQLQLWQEKGLVRYVGVSTHNRAIALELIKRGKCELLMHRYNMAHRKAEESVLPSAQTAGIPVIAFTCTRWGTLLKGHPNWQEKPPTAADCYRYVLSHGAVRLALTAPQNLQQLQENLAVLPAPPLSPAEIARWQAYGDLIYGNGEDAFETQWM